MVTERTGSGVPPPSRRYGLDSTGRKKLGAGEGAKKAVDARVGAPTLSRRGQSRISGRADEILSLSVCLCDGGHGCVGGFEQVDFSDLWKG